MSNHTIANLVSHPGKPGERVIVRGWVRTRRDSQAGLSFVTINDGSCVASLQVVVPATLENYTSEVLQLSAGCAVIISGVFVISPRRTDDVEVVAERVEWVGAVENRQTYPISPKPHTLEFLRTQPHLRVRTNVMGAMARVRHTAAQAIHRFFDEQGFYWVSTPIITSNDCEGAGQMFRVSTLDLMNLPRDPVSGKVDYSTDFFGRETFLTVSGQLNLESYCCALSKVYTFGPTFRAENSNTSRHLAEFWMVEPEIAFADLHDDAILAERLLKAVASAVLNERAEDMAFFAQRIEPQAVTRLESLVQSTFVRLTYTEAIRILERADASFVYPVQWGIDLQTEHERYLTEVHVQAPVVVTDYPQAIKAFYMRLNADGQTVAAMDVLAPGIGEIIGGSQREERLDVLDARMSSCGIDPASYEWYRDLRRYGSVPHAGFGLGFERLIAYLTGLTNIRDVIPFPRTPGHADD